MSENVAFALAAHPDDIEFMMSGTMLLLRRAGWRLHCMNVASGSCGTAEPGRDEIVRIRTAEARRSAEEVLGAAFHPPLVDDIQVFYEPGLLAQVAAIMREVNPRIVLLQSPVDYMEDHVNSVRLGVTAAFCRGMPNFPTDPPTEPVDSPAAVYHALPYGLTDPLRRPVEAEFYVDIAPVMEEKRRALACHESQKRWLDESQGLDSYLSAMETMAAEAGRRSGRFDFAEGWRRHSHLGFADADYDPLRNALDDGSISTPT